MVVSADFGNGVCFIDDDEHFSFLGQVSLAVEHLGSTAPMPHLNKAASVICLYVAMANGALMHINRARTPP